MAEKAMRECPHCYSEIDVRATVCPNCRSRLKRSAGWRVGNIIMALSVLVIAVGVLMWLIGLSNLTVLVVGILIFAVGFLIAVLNR